MSRLQDDLHGKRDREPMTISFWQLQLLRGGRHDPRHRRSSLVVGVNFRGEQATLGGEWKETWRKRNPGGRIGTLGNFRGQALKVAQKYHEQNTAVRLARAAGKQPELPEPDVRTKLARAEQKRLADLHSAF